MNTPNEKIGGNVTEKLSDSKVGKLSGPAEILIGTYMN